MPQRKKHRKARAVRKTTAPRIQPVWLAMIGAALVGGVLLLIIGLINRSGGNSSADPNFKPEVSGAPRVAVAQDTVDHGNVKLGNTIETDFQVRNIGDKDLVILGEPRVEVVEGC